MALRLYPVTKTETICDDYRVKIDGKDVAFTPWSDAKAKEQWKAWESSREMVVAAPH